MSHKKTVPMLSLPIAFLFLFAFYTTATKAACIGIGGCTCTASATPVAFGTYNPITGVQNTSTGTVSVSCYGLLLALNITYSVSLSTGSSGTYTARTMKNGTPAIAYNLYLNPTYATVWSNVSPTNTVQDGYLLQILVPTVRSYTVYGRILPLANQTPSNITTGSYSDTITATVTY